MAAAARRAQAVRVEEREVADRPGVLREEHPWVLGGPGLPHPRGAFRRGALQLPGGTRGRARGLNPPTAPPGSLPRALIDTGARAGERCAPCASAGSSL